MNMELLLLFGAMGLLPVLDFGNDSDERQASSADVDVEDDPSQPPDETNGDMLADLLREYEDLERPSGRGTPGDDVILPAEPAEGGRIDTFAGAGDDVVVGGDNINLIDGEAGDDTLFGGAGSDNLIDREGVNVLYGQDGADNLLLSAGSTGTGGADNDYFTLRPDTDVGAITITDFSEEEGDSIDHDLFLDTELASGNSLTGELWEDGTGQDFFFGETLIASIKGGETLAPEDFDLYIRATADSFSHGDSDGNIRAFGADQTIDGGEGDDWISSSLGSDDTGADVFRGGEGNDTLTAVGPSDALYRDGQGGTFSLTEAPELDGGAGEDVLVLDGTGIMTGGPGADTFGIEYSPGFVEERNADYQPAEITDFVKGEDILYLETSRGAAGEPVSVEPREDGTGSDVFVGDTLVLRVAGEVLSLDDIRRPDIDLSRDLLGYH